MSDPLSVTASVVGIVGALLHGSKRLYEFIDSLQNAPKDIAALSTDLRALYEILAHITNVQDRLSSHLALCVSLKAPLENCLSIFDEFTALLQGFTQTSRDGTIQVRVWKQMAWAFKDKEIQLFRDTITTYKVSLDMALSAMTFSTIASLNERTKRFELDFKEEFRDIKSRLQALDNDRFELASVAGCKGSEWYGTEADFAMKRFLEYTESLCDSPPASFPGSPIQITFQDYDGLHTQEEIQGSASSLQLKETDSKMAFVGQKSPGLPFGTIDAHSHVDNPSMPSPETIRRAISESFHLTSDYATPSALNIQSPSVDQQPAGSSWKPMTDLDLELFNHTDSHPGEKTSYQTMSQVAEIEQSSRYGRLRSNTSTKTLVLAAIRDTMVDKRVPSLVMAVAMPLLFADQRLDAALYLAEPCLLLFGLILLPELRINVHLFFLGYVFASCIFLL
ncbi:hypothetical protein NOF04DRAFT_11818 [Fusarium oxysporum II5]|uniref:Azaphilone pigments biosynthesis cluster protein L N-terminal domain-containing protein n=3 Tax=Fusarium oxysporum species complex TaxID=171631 RepID=N1SB08_FUSC4|nr:uncharacterized protein FOIG_02399 [Fusarium odoratissimum NRRL 54006]EMT72715.1 hypothetical protein FOC4_g10004192 [Fusarium odoratissimum]EXM07388.1 hypothetical protein FOIG_02399 [Fusarium odoratissimum NRRL 54006]KAK2130668.1 hypothetical protein NOF04DRAFT_11818 [Fusarium oxysporum II5]TXC10106.1 hypothetical protein FocTR4_00004510 [Fusarium oxysporum f. sp. cubense]